MCTAPAGQESQVNACEPLACQVVTHSRDYRTIVISKQEKGREVKIPAVSVCTSRTSTAAECGHVQSSLAQIPALPDFSMASGLLQAGHTRARLVYTLWRATTIIRTQLMAEHGLLRDLHCGRSLWHCSVIPSSVETNFQFKRLLELEPCLCLISFSAKP